MLRKKGQDYCQKYIDKFFYKQQSTVAQSHKNTRHWPAAFIDLSEQIPSRLQTSSGSICWRSISMIAGTYSSTKLVHDAFRVPGSMLQSFSSASMISCWQHHSHRCQITNSENIKSKWTEMTVSEQTKQVWIQLPTYADNVALPAFTRHCCSNQLISPARWAHSSKPATAGLTPMLRQSHAGSDRQTDGRTPCRFINPAPHTM